MITLTKLDNGNLKITLDDKDELEYIKDKGFDAKLSVAGL